MDKTKNCTKCEKELSVSYFGKNKRSKDGLNWKCNNCRGQERKKYAKQAAEYTKQYRKSNLEKVAEWDKRYRKNNPDKILNRNRKYKKNNPDKIAKWNKQYRKIHIEHITKRAKIYNKTNALFKTYSGQLEQFEEVRICSENQGFLEVKCSYCGKWMLPSNMQVRNRLLVFKGKMLGEQRFYCSGNCKAACPIFNQKLWPKGFKKATSREVVPLLRQLVLERDNYTCQRCGATSEEAQLHVHHEKSYTLNKMMVNDPDNCITLCKECHKEVHSQDGCRYSDLKC
jgi:5-methylcytosine-specific restriction endonuclease McrA